MMKAAAPNALQGGWQEAESDAADFPLTQEQVKRMLRNLACFVLAITSDVSKKAEGID